MAVCVVNTHTHTREQADPIRQRLPLGLWLGIVPLAGGELFAPGKCCCGARHGSACLASHRVQYQRAAPAGTDTGSEPQPSRGEQQGGHCLSSFAQLH